MDKTPYERGLQAAIRRGEYEFEYARGPARNPYPPGSREQLEWFDGFMEGVERRMTRCDD